jgi:hypothetical protein
MPGHDRLRVIAEQARRPEIGGEVVAVGFEEGGETAVEDDRGVGDRL